MLVFECLFAAVLELATESNASGQMWQPMERGSSGEVSNEEWDLGFQFER